MKHLFDPNLLQWYDGMPLSCHHFQQLNIREQKIAEYILCKIAPYSFGVINIEFELSIISNNNYFILKNLECILPDYSLLFFPLYNEEPIQFEIDPTINEIITLYCSVSEEYFAYENLLQRYRAILSEPVADLNTGENKEAIVRLSPIIQITDKKINNLSFPIAKIHCELGQLKLIEYDPPSPNFHTCLNSKNLVTNIVSELSLRVNNSYSKLKVKSEIIDFEEYGKIFMEQLLPLQFILKSINPSAIDVYKQILALAINILSIDELTMLNFEPKYNHEEIFFSFQEITKFIEEKIKLIDNRYSFDLNGFSFKNELYFREIDITCKEIDIILHFRGEFQEWIDNAIIISQDRLAEAQIMRIIGCKREIIHSSKKEIKRGEIIDFVKVRIYLDPEYLSSTTLAISNALDGENNPLGIYLL